MKEFMNVDIAIENRLNHQKEFSRRNESMKHGYSKWDKEFVSDTHVRHAN